MLRLKLRSPNQVLLSRVQDNIGNEIDSALRQSGSSISVSFTTSASGSAFVQLGLKFISGAQSTALRLVSGGDVSNVWSMTFTIQPNGVRLLYVGLDPSTKYTDRIAYA